MTVSREAVEPLPDLASLSDDELRKLIADLKRHEQEVSYQRRRMLHGRLDILRAELVARLQKGSPPSPPNTGVREPRRPKPSASGGAAALDLPENEESRRPSA
jgi:hypothetical protein